MPQTLKINQNLVGVITECNPLKLALVQLTTSSRRQDGGAYCEAAVGGKCVASKGKLFLYVFAV